MPVEVAAVACAADGISSVILRGSFYPLAAWTCVQDQVVSIEMERSVQVRATYDDVYAPNARCVWRFGSSAAGSLVNVTFSSFSVDLRKGDNLTIQAGGENGVASQKLLFHISAMPVLNVPYSLSLPLTLRFLSDATDQRSGFVLNISSNTAINGPVCGNGIRHPYEGCDDGNVEDGDGCNSQCQVEEGWACTGYIGGRSNCSLPACLLTCKNGGRCVVMPNGTPQCVCGRGWKGASCEVDVDMCECAFCSGVCWEGVGPNVTCCMANLTCHGHGNCTTEVGVCACEELYTAPLCHAPPNTSTPTMPPNQTTADAVSASPSPTLTPTPASAIPVTGTPRSCTPLGSSTATIHLVATASPGWTPGTGTRRVHSSTATWALTPLRHSPPSSPSAIPFSSSTRSTTATVSPCFAPTRNATNLKPTAWAEGPSVVYVTREELGQDDWLWAFHCINLGSGHWQLSLDPNRELFETNATSLELPPEGNATLRVRLRRPSPLPFPQKVSANLSLRLGSNGSLWELLRFPVTVYILPEPWLTSASGRSGDAANCRMTHNNVKSFTPILQLRGDLQPSLFRGVSWGTAEGTPIIQGNPMQDRMTIPAFALRQWLWLNVTAHVQFALPDDEGLLTTVSRQCAILINAGPNGSNASLMVSTAINVSGSGDSPAVVLAPQQEVRLRAVGWTHHSPILYAVWCYWTDRPALWFQLSPASEDPEHLVTIPGQEAGGTLVLFMRATDGWGYPDVHCPSCDWNCSVAAISLQEHRLALHQLLAGPWPSLRALLRCVAWMGALEDDAEAEQFLQRVRELADQNGTGLVVQAARSLAAHLQLRTAVTWYDVELAQLVSSLLNNSSSLDDAAHDGVAWLYGSALQRMVEPLVQTLGADLASLRESARRSRRTLQSDEGVAAAAAATTTTTPLFTGEDTEAPAALTKLIIALMVHKVGAAAFRDVDCMQSAPPVVAPGGPDGGGLCFTACSLTVYRDELGLNFSRLLFDRQVELPSGGANLLRFVIRNRAWGEHIQSLLPEFVTVASVRIGAECNFEVPRFDLSGALWRVWLLEPVSRVALTPFDSRPRVAVPAFVEPQPSDPLPDCMFKQEVEDNGFRSMPRSPLHGSCLAKQLGWVSVSEPGVFRPILATPFPWFVLVSVLVALTLLSLLAALAWAYLRRRDAREGPATPADPSDSLSPPAADYFRGVVGVPVLFHCEGELYGDPLSPLKPMLLPDEPRGEEPRQEPEPDDSPSPLLAASMPERSMGDVLDSQSGSEPPSSFILLDVHTSTSSSFPCISPPQRSSPTTGQRRVRFAIPEVATATGPDDDLPDPEHSPPASVSFYLNPRPPAVQQHLVPRFALIVPLVQQSSQQIPPVRSKLDADWMDGEDGQPEGTLMDASESTSPSGPPANPSAVREGAEFMDGDCGLPDPESMDGPRPVRGRPLADRCHNPGRRLEDADWMDRIDHDRLDAVLMDPSVRNSVGGLPPGLTPQRSIRQNPTSPLPDTGPQSPSRSPGLEPASGGVEAGAQPVDWMDAETGLPAVLMMDELRHRRRRRLAGLRRRRQTLDVVAWMDDMHRDPEATLMDDPRARPSPAGGWQAALLTPEQLRPGTDASQLAELMDATVRAPLDATVMDAPTYRSHAEGGDADTPANWMDRCDDSPDACWMDPPAARSPLTPLTFGSQRRTAHRGSVRHGLPRPRREWSVQRMDDSVDDPSECVAMDTVAPPPAIGAPGDSHGPVDPPSPQGSSPTATMMDTWLSDLSEVIFVPSDSSSNSEFSVASVCNSIQLMDGFDADPSEALVSENSDGEESDLCSANSSQS